MQSKCQHCPEKPGSPGGKQRHKLFVQEENGNFQEGIPSACLYFGLLIKNIFKYEGFWKRSMQVFFFNIYFYYNYLKIIYSDKKKETGINRN